MSQPFSLYSHIQGMASPSSGDGILFFVVLHGFWGLVVCGLVCTIEPLIVIKETHNILIWIVILGVNDPWVLKAIIHEILSLYMKYYSMKCFLFWQNIKTITNFR